MDIHPEFCATRGPVPCGHHLAEPMVIEATADGDDGRLEVAAARTAAGLATVAVTVVEAGTGRAVTVLLRHREVDEVLKALVSHDDLARA